MGVNRTMRELSFGELVNSSVQAPPIHESQFDGLGRELTFADIVSPDGPDSIPESAFVKHFCAKQVLHIAQNDRARFEHLLSWQRINEILSLNLLDRDRLRITRDGRDIPPSLYREEDAERDPVVSSKLHELLKQNASVVMNGAQFLSPGVLRIARQMEMALNQKVNVNGYMTFGPGGAFAVHYDPHDVLVLQVYGTKHWFIYEDPEPSPTLYEKARAKKPEDRPVAFETILQPGDALYVPRGFYHRAAVTDTNSVHLTFGMMAPRGLDFVDWVRSELQKEVMFREDILTLRGPEAVAQQEQALKARLCEIINGAPLCDYLDSWQRSRKPFNQFRVGPREELHEHTLLAPLLRYRGAWRRSVEKKGAEPAPAAEAILDVLLEEQFATVGQVKGKLGSKFDEDTIVATLGDLIDESWIEIVR